MTVGIERTEGLEWFWNRDWGVRWWWSVVVGWGIYGWWCWKLKLRTPENRLFLRSWPRVLWLMSGDWVYEVCSHGRDWSSVPLGWSAFLSLIVSLLRGVNRSQNTAPSLCLRKCIAIGKLPEGWSPVYIKAKRWPSTATAEMSWCLVRQKLNIQCALQAVYSKKLEKEKWMILRTRSGFHPQSSLPQDLKEYST